MVGIEINLVNNNFLTICETLTRIGVGNKKSKVLSQSCHLLQKQGRFYIVHFKEMFILDGKESTLDAEDVERRNLIAYLLSQWGIVKIVDMDSLQPMAPIGRVIVLPFKDKQDWTLVQKYSFGK